MKVYDPQTIEEKWLQTWKDQKLFQGTATQDAQDKYYILYAFAYPSGSGLHVGHVEPTTALDMLARYYRMTGKNVFFPVGWDAFGLPAENYAIKTGIPPAETTKKSIANFEKQIARVGISYDWETEVATCHPGYYKWTQWIFTQLFKEGLAYRDTSFVNWCPQDKTVLANEQVVNGECERCGTKVIQKELEQWKFKITAYQDELIDGLAQVDWPHSTKLQQENWIGRSQGVEVTWKVAGHDTHQLQTFTTRLDTIYGVTFVVISPEKWKELQLESLVPTNQREQIDAYLDMAAHKTEEERRIGEKDKTGVSTGLQLIHPLTNEAIPLWIADYVLAGYGTGVVMGVPAHDARDHAFAKKFTIPMIQVVTGQPDPKNGLFSGYGPLVNSGEYSGMESESAVERMVHDHPQVFEKKTTYKLRDWLISRQRYWGAPIPMVYCADCAKAGKGEQSQMPGWYAVADTQLPVMLPDVPDFLPTDDGHSPLEKANDEWKYTVCPGCKGKATREVDTMDTFVDSSWYFLRYVDARNEEAFASKEQLKKWLPVDTYLIGPEHIVLHLLYARFFTKFLRDQGYYTFDEPFMKMRHQGMILGPDGKKMSKSKGNVISPDEVIEKFGADTLRVYEMFMGPLDADKAWDTNAVAGVYRFLTKIYSLVQSNQEAIKQGVVVDQELRKKLHKTIKKVGEDIPEYKYNTAIAALMEFCNLWQDVHVAHATSGLSEEDLRSFVKILAPFAPFLADELYSTLSGDLKDSVHLESWPTVDLQLIEDEEVEIVVQVNAKVKGRFFIAAAESKQKDVLEKKALEVVKAQNLDGGSTSHMIVIPGKLVNVVIK